jgi:hypothetical protein
MATPPPLMDFQRTVSLKDALDVALGALLRAHKDERRYEDNVKHWVFITG